MLTMLDGGGHNERTKAENDGEALDGKEQQPWKVLQCSGRWRGVRGKQHATQAYKRYKKHKDYLFIKFLDKTQIEHGSKI